MTTGGHERSQQAVVTEAAGAEAAATPGTRPDAGPAAGERGDRPAAPSAAEGPTERASPPAAEPSAGAESVPAGGSGPGAPTDGAAPTGGESATSVSADASAAGSAASSPVSDAPAPDLTARLADALALADARLGDLQRERADFVNYRRRVERDRDQAAVEARLELLSSLLGVLDDIDGARRNDELTGPFAAIAEKLEQTLGRAGLEGYGEVGEEFDPARHEALLHDGETEASVPTCTQVLQRGYRVGDRVLRPARVAVAGSA